jgi:ribonucleoside-diphosphate reductase alpha chain
LTTINGTKVQSPEEFYEFARVASFIGTLQATYTDFKYLSPEAKQLTEEESLLGVSLLAMMESPEILLNPAYQRVAANVVNRTNKIWAERLGINPAARTTCIKPDGSVSLAMGTLASGIHPVHSENMIRRVQVNRLEPVYQFFKQINPELCESSVWGDKDDIISFPIHNPERVKTKDSLTAIEHLEIIKKTQENWINSGRTEFNNKLCSHSVSCSVVVSPDEWQKVIDYLSANKNSFTAVSLIPKTLDTDYPQAPNQKVDSNEVVRLQTSLKPVDYSLLSENYEFSRPELETACYGNACMLS